MNETFSQVPECPDPPQLELFDCLTSNVEPINSAVSAGTTASIEFHTRDPAFDDKREYLTESQKKLANALLYKSRALASKIRNYEDD